jgi:hypothetical protein
MNHMRKADVRTIALRFFFIFMSFIFLLSIPLPLNPAVPIQKFRCFLSHFFFLIFLEIWRNLEIW